MSQTNLNLSKKAAGPVECLGQTFASEEARREHYLKLLAQKLKDPEFRKIEGFPIGKDEDILALSDPPYYTACPNPWLGEFIKAYGTSYDPKKPYHREPFVADVKEGKGHPIYNAHSYHTKVPHRAIMRYILHYTQPGDVVFDGFCGTGMTGVAAQLCGSRTEVQELGYRVQDDGTILNEEGKVFSKLGARHAILSDLSPVATFISRNYNSLTDAAEFEKEANEILAIADRELSGAFQTLHSDGRTHCDVKLTIWSDALNCPNCGDEFVFWERAANPESGALLEPFECPGCGTRLSKKDCELRMESIFDPVTGSSINRAKKVPVALIYKHGGKRFEKQLDSKDLATIQKFEASKPPRWVPSSRMMEGGETRRNDDTGFTHVHHYYTGRNLAALSIIRDEVFHRMRKTPALGLWFTSSHPWVTRLARLIVSNYFNKTGGIVAPTLQGTLYICSVMAETNAIDRFRLRINSVPYTVGAVPVAVSTGSTSRVPVPSNSIDYLFLDPPFGANIAYSELNYLWESWLGVITAYSAEAIENRPHNKSLADYHKLIKACFAECYRVLKPGRWMTVEFSNTKAAVWNSIQSALSEVGFVVANVSILEKEHKGYRAVTTTTAVREDLAITAYKPNGGLEERFAKRGETEEGVWDFARTHLKNLPVVKAHGGQLAFIAERDPRTLYDRMVAFYVGHSTPVPLGSGEFQAGLAEKFPERDGMFFLPEQVNEYDKKRAQVENIGQLTIFVEDERSAINWLRSFLKDRPSTYQDIQPEFMQQLGASWKKWEARPEMSALLDQNFLCYDGVGEVPSQIHSYLSTQFKVLRNLPKNDKTLQAEAKNRWYVPDPKKNVDVETLRNKRLLEEFWSYLPEGYTPPSLTANKGQTLPGLAVPRPKIPKGKKLKELRTEAVRVGFKHCYQQKDYTTILVVAEMIPDSVLNEDEQLQMIYDTAVTRSGASE